MKHLKTASIPVALGAMVLASALTVQGSTTTNTWFDAGISGYQGTELGAAPWTKPAGDASVVDTENSPKSISLDTKGAFLTYTRADGPLGTNTFVDLSIKFVPAEADPDMTGASATAKASLAVRKSGSDLCYIARSNGAWVQMYGVTPVENAFVDVRVELDYAADPNPLVRYFVKDNGNWVALSNAASGGAEWIPLAVAPGQDFQAKVSTISFSGTGNVSALSGQYYYELASLYIVSVDDADKPILLTPEWLSAHSDLTDAAAINAYLAETGANGLPKWKSYVLGLESESAPIWVGTVANGDASKMTIKMNGPGATLPASGITVTYRLEKQNGSSWTAVGEDQSSPQFDLSLANDPTGRYRVLAVFTAAE